MYECTGVGWCYIYIYIYKNKKVMDYTGNDQKMDVRRNWKCVNTEEGRKNYRRLRNELKRATDNAKKEYLENICNEIMEFQTTGRYDLMYMKRKQLGWRETHRIQNIGIEDSQGNRISEQSQVLKI